MSMPYDKRSGRKERGGAQNFSIVLCGSPRPLLLCVKIYSLKRSSFHNQLEVKRHNGHMLE